MEKILFLDMNGAGANSSADISKLCRILHKRGFSPRQINALYNKAFKVGLEAIFPSKARLVSEIIAQTGAKIVWSTSWRCYEPYKSSINAARRMLTRRRMPGNALIGFTPQLKCSYPRSAEIKSYLRQNFPDKTSCRCAVLDDMPDAGFQLPSNCRFFKKAEHLGLTYSIANDIINWLNQNTDENKKVNEIAKQCRVVNNYIFFLKGPFSQWYMSEMQENGTVFNCCEQYMMYHKAKLFGDLKTANKILASSDPLEQKRLGRIVANFNERVWNAHKEKIVYQGNFLKFSQNERLKEYLLSTGNNIIVEANKYDRIWGIGMYADDKNLLRTELWGKNLLGKAIMQVRENLQVS